MKEKRKNFLRRKHFRVLLVLVILFSSLFFSWRVKADPVQTVRYCTNMCRDCYTSADASTWDYVCNGTGSVGVCSYPSYTMGGKNRECVACSGPTYCGYGYCGPSQRPYNWRPNYNGSQCIYSCYNSSSCCSSYYEKRCAYGDVYWYDSCGNRENKAQDCESVDYCDTGGDVYEYCSGGDVWGEYDFAFQGCSGGSCYTSWNYNSCGHEKLEDCGSDSCDASWGDWYCADGNTRERARTCYNRGCSGGSCYENPYQDTEQIDCEKDGYPGKCIGGSCYYNGSCGSATGDTFCDLPERGEDNLCAINFGSNGEPDSVYDDAGGDKSQDKFLWTCYGWHPDGSGDIECEAERDCQVVPQRGWQEN